MGKLIFDLHLIPIVDPLAGKALFFPSETRALNEVTAVEPLPMPEAIIQY